MERRERMANPEELARTGRVAKTSCDELFAMRELGFDSDSARYATVGPGSGDLSNSRINETNTVNPYRHCDSGD